MISIYCDPNLCWEILFKSLNMVWYILLVHTWDMEEGKELRPKAAAWWSLETWIYCICHNPAASFLAETSLFLEPPSQEFTTGELQLPSPPPECFLWVPLLRPRAIVTAEFWCFRLRGIAWMLLLLDAMKTEKERRLNAEEEEEERKAKTWEETNKSRLAFRNVSVWWVITYWSLYLSHTSRYNALPKNEVDCPYEKKNKIKRKKKKRHMIKTEEKV